MQYNFPYRFQAYQLKRNLLSVTIKFQTTDQRFIPISFFPTFIALKSLNMQSKMYFEFCRLSPGSHQLADVKLDITQSKLN